VNSRIPQVPPSHYEHPWPFRRQSSFSRELIQKLDGCEWEWKYHDETNARCRAVYRHHFRDRRNTRDVRSHCQVRHLSQLVERMHGCSVRLLLSAERRLTMCKFNLAVAHGRSDVPPSDEQRFLLTWKFIFLSFPLTAAPGTTACHRFHGRQLIINRKLLVGSYVTKNRPTGTAFIRIIHADPRPIPSSI
jgi:hypothetical protein